MSDAPGSPIGDACEGELRSSLGETIFIPHGSDQYLRVAVEAELEEGFRQARCRMTLRQTARGILRTQKNKLPLGVEPQHGVPERAVADVLAQRGRELVLGAGKDGAIRLIVTVPDDEPYEGRVLCELDPPLVGADVSFLDR